MSDKSEEHDDPANHEESESIVERPLECSECKKSIAVLYTEIVGNVITKTCMCADCPVLSRRFHQCHVESVTQEGELSKGLACGNCGTTLESLRMGLPVGCPTCYEVFDDILLGEIVTSGKVPPRTTTNKKSIPIHIGRSPGESQEMNPTLRLLALNEALSETLKREDYEQAAWLRDQIKALTEHPENNNESK